MYNTELASARNVNGIGGVRRPFSEVIALIALNLSTSIVVYKFTAPNRRFRHRNF